MGFELRTLVAQHHPQPFRIQWDRTVRWRDRAAEAIRRGSDHEPYDYLFALFANILQTRDWLRGSHPELSADINSLYRTSPNLGLIRDVANGSKHLDLTHYSIDGAATIAREYSDSGDRFVVPMSGTQNRDALALADAAMGELRAFMGANDLP